MGLDAELVDGGMMGDGLVDSAGEVAAGEGMGSQMKEMGGAGAIGGAEAGDGCVCVG